MEATLLLNDSGSMVANQIAGLNLDQEANAWKLADVSVVVFSSVLCDAANTVVFQSCPS